MPWASFSMLDGPGGTGCDVPVIHIIVQDQDGQNNNINMCIIKFNIYVSTTNISRAK